MVQNGGQRITITDLLREPGPLLDAVEVDRASFVVYRYGRPVAHLTPAEVTSRRRRERRRSVDAVPPAPVERARPVDPELLQSALCEDGRLVLNAIVEKGSEGLYLGEIDGMLPGNRMSAALGLLELARLIRSEGMWLWATESGREHAGG